MNDIMNKLLTALAALAVMVSCGNSDEPKQEESILTVTTKSLSFDYSGGTQTVNVVSSIDPGINCKDSWLTVTKGEYLDKNVQLTIVAATNTTSSVRKGNVSINGDKLEDMDGGDDDSKDDDSKDDDSKDDDVEESAFDDLFDYYDSL